MLSQIKRILLAFQVLKILLFSYQKFYDTLFISSRLCPEFYLVGLLLFIFYSHVEILPLTPRYPLGIMERQTLRSVCGFINPVLYVLFDLGGYVDSGRALVPPPGRVPVSSSGVIPRFNLSRIHRPHKRAPHI